MSARYIRIREIGRGGMAVVYLARQEGLDRLVAVKVLLPETMHDADYVRRFVREARLTARLRHPHIVTVIESHVSADECFIVTEYAEAGDFGRLLGPGGPPLREKLGILLHVAEALEYAHGQGVVHRDVKPSNILLTAELAPKLCDFGIATALWGQTPQLTRTHEAMGTLDFIAPEQKEDARRVDARADQFSFGVLLYITVTGRKPLGAFPPPLDLVPGIPPRLNALVMRCLQPRPQERFPSTAALVGDLRQLLEAGAWLEGAAGVPPAGADQPTVARPGEGLESGLRKLQNASLGERTALRARLLESVGAADVPRLLLALEREQGFVRETAIQALGRLGARSACAPLLRLLGDPELCKPAAAALGDIGCPEAEGPLLQLLQSGSEAAWSAMMPLGRLRSVRALKPISRFLRSEHKWVRELAVEALGAIGHPESRPHLEQAAGHDGDAGVRARAKNILWRLNHEGK